MRDGSDTRRHTSPPVRVRGVVRGARRRSARAEAVLARLHRPRRHRTRLRGTSGQASVELVAIVPLLVAVALAVGQLLAAGAARELAGHAAEAAAIALGRGDSASEAGRAALPGWSRDGLEIEVDGRRVTATVRPLPLVPPLADRLAASVTADAGPRSGAP